MRPSTKSRPVRCKSYWKDPKELAKRSEWIRWDLQQLVRLAQDGFTMETISEFGTTPVRFLMGHVFLNDLPHQAAIDPVLDAMFECYD